MLLGGSIGDCLPGLLVQGKGQLQLLSVTEHRQRHGIPRLMGGLGSLQVLESDHVVLIHGGDDVPRLQSRLGGAGAVLHCGHIDTQHRVGDAVLLRYRGRHGHAGNAHVGLSGNIAVLDQVGDDVLHIVDGDGEAQALHIGAGAGGAVFGGGDADDLPVAVEQGAAGVARVDGAVGLKHVHRGGVIAGAGGNEPVQSGDEAVGEGVCQLAQGVADGHHGLAHLQLVGVAQGHGLEPGGLDLQHGHIVVLLAPHQGSGVAAAVVKGDGDAHRAVLHRVLNDVVVGDDVPVGGDDEAGTGGGRRAGIAEDVGHGGGHRDAHAGVHIGGVQLLRGHGLAAGAGHRVRLGGDGLGVLIDHAGLGREDAGVQGCAAHARSAAHYRAGQDQRRNAPAGSPVLLGPLGGLRPALALVGVGIGVPAEAAPVPVILTIIEIELIVLICHFKHSLPI